MNISKNVGWRVGAFLKSYNNIDDPLPTFLYSNPQSNFRISQTVKRKLKLLNNVKMGGVIIVLKFFVTLWCKSTSL